MKKLVLTGAAGRLGSYLREPLTQMCDELVSTDIVEDIGKLYPGETYMKGDLASLDDMLRVLEGADMVVHMGAYADEGPFEELLGPNFIGAYNIWEAAYRQGLRRVVYGSSIHAVGMHPKTDFIGTDAPHRPDTFYGLAKCFAEDLGSMYWDKRGLESVHMRILSCAQVNNARALGSWLSYDDLIQLVQRSIDTPVTGFSVVYGVSNNDRVPVDNSKASFLGYRPKDNAEQFAEQVLADTPPMDNQDPGNMCHGGPFASVELGNSGVASMNIVNDKKET
ncbi:NAD(P)-dependent oxidoreductase [Sulfitobacter mediterraneus]|jgi:uronate dehydrogenase|uniref:NAD-dependent epimerase/dehydratase family protein n=1 Tax=Sulfitobacter mediterraneus TaxID=83219 RepID=UPI00193209E6|nr:NAD(P)-dependent oxidoreductase [Sulfitobacter mediterraneus]MBM1634466.1 NAD(P)-dependent oxidoreductase [Sulfitobacter mediterraneus]MBM1642283.1 NAD(P)-dependent oxidoreductase [Sulfitobacter mediterraneus]MBM1646332.1 NAD(P)-dependent oxidoreductase [Sulfitobacter mediterraneus]MBM1650378.1 NAD(P)-dependent oxidoreductase [Sulfitobacter mediterraneus]MBM1654400.1 NAD(P)-dependent oxidoreductase [Sulfitobacter mediterraneus]